MLVEYRYGLVNRPAGIATVPANKPYRLEPPLPDASGRALTRYGVIVFERPLTVDELYAFDLALLADDDLKEALAIEVALELAAFEIDWEIACEEPQSFCIKVAEFLGKIRLYRVHVGDLAQFSQLVLARLKAISETKARENADVLSVLYAQRYAPVHRSSPMS
jgi:hypothetical protein